MRHMPRGDMTPQELAQARRQAKHAAYMNAIGKPLMITEEEGLLLLAHIKRLADSGMSGHAIAMQAGVASVTTVNRLIRGESMRTLRRNYDRMMGVEADPLSSYPPRHGKAMPVWPARRRLQALVADGFPPIFLARLAGIRHRNSQWYRIINGYDHCEMTTPFYMGLSYDLYDKLAGAKPEDYRVTHQQYTRTLTLAKKRKFVPSGCWDSDTLDDIDGIPDWTGGPCGTRTGWWLHYKYKIYPVCRPCMDAKNEYEQERRAQ